MFVDLKAPRFNPRKFRKPIVTPELHAIWKKENNSNLTFLQFRKIWDEIAEGIKTGIYEERDGVRLTGLGDMYLGYVPGTKRGVDYKLSKELGKEIYHENWHSDGKMGKIIYAANGRPYIYRYWYMWAFQACREFTRSATKAFFNNPERYKISQERFPKIKLYDERSRDNISSQDRAETS